MTKRAPASICLTRSSRLVNTGVHSNTTSITHQTPRQLRRFTFAQNRIVDAINIQTSVPGVDLPGPSSITVSNLKGKRDHQRATHSSTDVRRSAGLSSICLSPDDSFSNRTAALISNSAITPFCGGATRAISHILWQGG